MANSLDAERLATFERRILHAARGDIIDLEFSEYGRGPRFVSGWWICPGLLLGIALLVFFVID
jgi:hypothetical protein